MSEETRNVLIQLKEKINSKAIDSSPFKEKGQTVNEACVFYFDKGIETSVNVIDSFLNEKEKQNG